MRDSSMIRTMIARSDSLRLGKSEPICDTDPYACFLKGGDTLEGSALDDAWRLIGAVCMNLIFTGNLCCGYRNDVYG